MRKTVLMLAALAAIVACVPVQEAQAGPGGRALRATGRVITAPWRWIRGGAGAGCAGEAREARRANAGC